MSGKERKGSPRALVWGTTLLAASLVYAAGSNVTVEGEINLHDGATATGVTGTEGTNSLTGSIPAYTYTAPSTWDETRASELGPVTLNGPGTGNVKTIKFDGSGGNSTFDQAPPAKLVVDGGGTVIVHIPGNLTIDQAAIEIRDGTELVFMVDGNVTFNWAQITQSGGGRVLIEAGGDVTINTEKFTGAGFANGNLSFDAGAGGDLTDKVFLDASLLAVPSKGKAKRLRMLPIVEGK